MRGRSRLGDEFIEEMAEMALRDRIRSRSRGRTDGALMDRPEFAEWRLEQKERELEEQRRRQLWEKEAELKRLKDDAKREKADTAADEERKRIIAEYAEKQRKDAEKAKAEEQRIKEKLEREERESRERAKAEEQRIKEKMEREAREAKEKEKREWEDFLRRQKEKEEKEKAEKAAEKEKFETEMRRRLAKFGYAQNQIDVMVDEEKAKQYREERSRSRGRASTGGAMELWRETRAPTYAKVHRDYLSIDTLIYYDIPYEFDRVSSDFHSENPRLSRPLTSTRLIRISSSSSAKWTSTRLRFSLNIRDACGRGSCCWRRRRRGRIMHGTESETVARAECGRWGFWSIRRSSSLTSGELVCFVRSMWVGDPARRHNSSELLRIVDRDSLEGCTTSHTFSRTPLRPGSLLSFYPLVAAWS